MRALRVLIAGEKDLVTARLAAQLESLGHRVIGTIKDGQAAVEFVGRSHLDLVLVDQNIPPLDGIEVARAILTRHPPTPLLLVIGYPAAGLVRRAQEAGVLAYLVWPADAKTVGSAIEVALTRFRELRVLCEQAGDLQQALGARMVVERAKKVLMRRQDLGEAEAFGYLRRQSRRAGTPIEDVAACLVTVEELWFGKRGLVECVDTILHVLARSEALGPFQVA